MIWSRTQAARGPSSCEIELNELGSAAAACLLLASFLEEQHLLKETIVLDTDSSGALQLYEEPGQGRLMAAEVRF